MSERINQALKKARKLEDYQCEPHIQALAVIEAALSALEMPGPFVMSWQANLDSSLNAWADAVLKTR